MYDLNTDILAEARKLDEKIKKLQEEKAEIEKRLETEKQRLELARKVGLIVVNEFQGKRFEYTDLDTLLEKHLVLDFDRQFFDLNVLPENDPRRPKRRGRKKREEA